MGRSREERLALALIEISAIKLDVCGLHDALRSQGARVDELSRGARRAPKAGRS